MRFMSIVTTAHTDMPTPELMEAMGKLADREIKAGRMIDMGGLMPLETGAQVRIRDGELSVTHNSMVYSTNLGIHTLPCSNPSPCNPC